MRSFGKFTRQILTRKVQLLVQVTTPFGAIGHIINDASMRDKLSGAALTCIAVEFHFRDDVFRAAHARDYTGYHSPVKRNLLPPCRRSLRVLIVFFWFFWIWNLMLLFIFVILI